MIDFECAELSYEIAQLADSEISGIEIRCEICQSITHDAERNPAIVRFHLGYNFSDDGDSVPCGLQWLSCRNVLAIAGHRCWRQVFCVDKTAAGLPETLWCFALAKTIDVHTLLTNTCREPCEIAIGRHKAKAIKSTAVQKIHSIDHQGDVGGVSRWYMRTAVGV